MAQLQIMPKNKINFKNFSILNSKFSDNMQNTSIQSLYSEAESSSFDKKLYGNLIKKLEFNKKNEKKDM